MDREWMREACQRLVQEAEHTRLHFAALEGMAERWGDQILTGQLTEEEFKAAVTDGEMDEMCGECYSFLSHLFLIHGAVNVMLSEAWKSPLIPNHVKAEAAKEQVEMMTGDPFEVVGVGEGGFLIHKVDIEVPDDASELDGEIE